MNSCQLASRKIGIGLLAIGFVAIPILATNTQPDRNALAVFFLSIALLSGAFSKDFLSIRWRIWDGIMLVIILFFWVQAGASPVLDDVFADRLLILLALGGYVLGRDLSRQRFFLKCFIPVLLMNGIYAVYQQWFDPSQAFLQLPRTITNGVSGLYWHRNPFGVLMAVVFAWALGEILFRKKGCKWWFVIMLIGLVLGFLSKSRSAVAAIFMSGALLVFFRLSCDWVFSFKGQTKKELRSMILICLLSPMILLLVVFGVTKLRQGNYALNYQERALYVDIATQLWQKKPWLGHGAQVFDQLSRPLLLPSGTAHLGRPNFVHNEYFETLLSYGVVGFLGLLTIVSTAWGLVWLRLRKIVMGHKTLELKNQLSSCSVASRLAVVGSILFMSWVDFALHIGAGVFLFAWVLGGLFAPIKPVSEGKNCFWLSGVFTQWVLGVCGVIMLIFSANQAKGWLVFQFIKEGKEVQIYEQMAEKYPNYRRFRKAGLIYLKQAKNVPLEQTQKHLKLAELALKNLTKAVDRNPYEPDLLTTLGNLNSQLKKYPEAETWYAKAMDAVGLVDHHYGVRVYYGQHAFVWGKQLWLERKYPEALSLFKRSKILFFEGRRIKWNWDYYNQDPGINLYQKNIQNIIVDIEKLGITESLPNGAASFKPEWRLP